MGKNSSLHYFLSFWYILKKKFRGFIQQANGRHSFSFFPSHEVKIYQLCGQVMNVNWVSKRVFFTKKPFRNRKTVYHSSLESIPPESEGKKLQTSKWSPGALHNNFHFAFKIFQTFVNGECFYYHSALRRRFFEKRHENGGKVKINHHMATKTTKFCWFCGFCSTDSEIWASFHQSAQTFFLHPRHGTYS